MPPVKPEITSFLLADMVIQEKGTNKWSAIGIFDRIQTASFPFVHPSLALYIRLSDAEGDYAIRVEFCDDNDHILGVFEGITLTVSSRLHNPELGIRTVNLHIPRPGKYYFKLYFNGEFSRDIPLLVREIAQNTEKVC
ncbi:MAG: hypothetical protein HZB37_00550 [Planctomycetes bacterium]|nr:hypothetical protein [Planctomycetota bacterium]